MTPVAVQTVRAAVVMRNLIGNLLVAFEVLLHGGRSAFRENTANRVGDFAHEGCGGMREG